MDVRAVVEDQIRRRISDPNRGGALRTHGRLWATAVATCGQRGPDVFERQIQGERAANAGRAAQLLLPAQQVRELEAYR